MSGVSSSIIWRTLVCLFFSGSRCTYFTSRHLIFPGCSHHSLGNGIEFWRQLHASLVAGFGDDGTRFTTINCPANKAAERAAVDAIVASYAQVPNAHVLLVASPVFPHLCYGTASQCPTPMDPFEPYNSSLSMGLVVTHFWVENAPDLPLNSAASLKFIPNNKEGGQLVGEAYCRRVRSSRPQRIAVFYGDPQAQHSYDRIDGFRSVMQLECPEHSVVFQGFANWSRETAKEMASLLFLRDASVRTVVCASDSMALGVIDAAREFRSDGISGLIVLGYDNTDEIKEYVASGIVPVTIDMLSAHKDDGLSLQIRKAVRFLDAKADRRLSLDSAQLSALFGMENNSTQLQSRVLPYVTNMEQFLTGRILDSYDPVSRPFHNFDFLEGGCYHSAPTMINTSFRVLHLEVHTSKFEVEGAISLSWHDPRLRYDGLLPHGCVDKLVFPRSVNFWRPNVFFAGALGSDSVFHEAMDSGQDFSGQDGEYLAEVFPDGLINWVRKVTLRLSCSMDFSKLPTDTQSCLYSVGLFSSDAQHVLIRWADDEPFINPKKSLSEWDVRQPRLYAEIVEGYSFARAEFTFERKSIYYNVYVIAPNFIFVGIAWCSFFVTRMSAPARAAMTLICLLASSGQVASILTMLPRGTGNVWLLSLLLASRYFIFYSVVEFAVVNFLARIEKRYTEGKKTRSCCCLTKKDGQLRVKAHHLDIASRYLFPIAYGIALVVFYVPLRNM